MRWRKPLRRGRRRGFATEAQIRKASPERQRENNLYCVDEMGFLCFVQRSVVLLLTNQNANVFFVGCLIQFRIDIQSNERTCVLILDFFFFFFAMQCVYFIIIVIILLILLKTYPYNLCFIFEVDSRLNKQLTSAKNNNCKNS